MYDMLRTYALNLNILRNVCHEMAVEKGWWDDVIHEITNSEITPVLTKGEEDQLIAIKKGSSIALMHSELSECLEAIRKDLPSDHLHGRSMEEEELADVIIRIMDYCGRYDIDIGEVMIEKIAFNAERSRRHGGKKL